MNRPPRKRLIQALLFVVLLAAIGLVAWYELRPSGLGDAIASGNGRMEATEIDIATKLSGRVAEILVDEGDFVAPGQLLARMDTRTLDAQLRQAQAELQRMHNALQTALAQVAQNESTKAAAEAVVLQRRAELTAARKRYERSNTLVQRNAISRQQLDDDRAAMQSAEAALAASRAQVSAAEAAIVAARSQVVEAQSAIDAADASVAKVQADLDDSQLHADRLARVQYRVAEPGEVLASGGKVLNLIDLTDVYMTFFLPTSQAGRVALGDDVHLVLDAAPEYVIPARVSFVANAAQFTPKTVETASEREKLMFRIRARIDPQLLLEHLEQVKTGLPGMAYLKLDSKAEWPDFLQVNVNS
ncbi:HlyD family efflux transporter periplasmic adaptor subunit [Halomonas sp. HP20-15]|uniref:HlyD family secretion protein n=1 Tax=Halomonas sp. HP20-15 TaxID=3085901 RepID=UPI0029828018|nr:HlyD family efflux transporter periplasmic adaptor subunit [Halomonas sp. HP20-15]MDW5377934.1 HlyD family efflux transporter periplasmic adaptor subunit [Halomonas sp. HP20-15]